MILYFDTYITDIPLNPKKTTQLYDDVRSKVKAYKMPKKIDIAKYTLASYATYPWSHVLIRYELEDPKGYKEFDKYITTLYPKAQIIHKRSDSQKDYKDSIKFLEKFKDDWIFYAPNNDHPLITSDVHVSKYINQLIKIADKWKQKYEFVSITYSHFSVFLNIARKGTVEHFVEGRHTKLLEEMKDAVVYLNPEGDFSSVQIVHKDHFKKWFGSVNLGNKRIIRAEDVRDKVEIKNQIIIAPRREICAHFDQNLHMLGTVNEVQNDQIPPLFIPQGFFEKDIHIAYGYSNYREGWVNINPCAKRYSFRDNKYGTDLKISLDQIPFFWKKYMKTIDVNKELNKQEVKRCLIEQEAIINNPWAFRVGELNINIIKFWLRYFFYVLNIGVRSAAKSTVN